MNRPLPNWRHWFSGRSAISRLPQECIDDCSSSGRVDEAVKYWVNRLNFDAPSWLLREHLKQYGAWDKSELCNHQDNLERLIWVWSSDCKENADPNYLVYLG
jgi:hypothetical protein